MPMPLRILLSVALSLAMAACADIRAARQPAPSLFRDEAFVAPASQFRADDLFALDAPMRRFLSRELARQVRSLGAARGLLEALYRQGQLRLEYDASRTRTASEAFAARAGNCLSLVIMTAAFAKELGLSVQYHSADIRETWSRNRDLLLGSGHVNITLIESEFAAAIGVHQYGPDALLVDFLPSDEIRGLPLRDIDEDTVVAMYMNNRAVETLLHGQLDAAYGWARAAIRRAPGFGNSYNTLGLIYLRHGDAAQAAAVFDYRLQDQPDDPILLSNLADALEVSGDRMRAAQVRARLARLDPDPPYRFFRQGVDAMQHGDYGAARDLFAREVARADYNDEFHFWLALAYFELGQQERARRQLMLAAERSQTRADRQRYVAKLEWLKGLRR